LAKLWPSKVVDQVGQDHLKGDSVKRIASLCHPHALRGVQYAGRGAYATAVCGAVVALLAMLAVDFAVPAVRGLSASRRAARRHAVGRRLIDPVVAFFARFGLEITAGRCFTSSRRTSACASARVVCSGGVDQISTAIKFLRENNNPDPVFDLSLVTALKVTIPISKNWKQQ